MKTLVIVSHPYAGNSVFTRAAENVARELGTEITVRNLDALYGTDTSAFNVAEEQAACEGMDRIVFMFPIHWFNLTPMLKAYLNEVWAYGWAFGPEGTALKGKELLVITTAGAHQQMYSHEGLVQSTMAEVLTPLKASALYVGMTYAEPLVLFGAGDDADNQVESYKQQVLERLNH